MEFDLRLPPHASLSATREIAGWAEGRGLVTLWSSEAGRDPFLPLVAACESSSFLGVGTGIAVAFARSPVATAHAAWDLQRMSGGRFTLGLGSQVRAHIERRYGLTWAGAAGPLREYVGVLRHAWHCWQSGERPSFRGRWYRFDLSNPEFEPPPLPGEQAAIPVWLAAVGPAMAALAGEVADGIHVHAFHTESYLRERLLPAVAGGQQATGRPVSPLPASSPVLAGVAHDDDEARALADDFRRHVAFYASTPAYLPVLEHAGAGELHPPLKALARAGRWDDMAALVPDSLLDRFVVVDSAREVGSRLRSRYAGVLSQLSLYRGADRFMTATDWDDLLTALRSSGQPGQPGQPGRLN